MWQIFQEVGPVEPAHKNPRRKPKEGHADSNLLHLRQGSAGNILQQTYEVSNWDFANYASKYAIEQFCLYRYKHGGANVKCTMCDTTFAHEVKLKAHMKNVHTYVVSANRLNKGVP